MKLNRKFILLMSTILLLVSSFVFTYALFKSSKDYDDITFKVGDISLELKGKIIDGYGEEGYIVPGQDLIEVPFVIINNSTVNLFIKIIIEVKIYDEVLNDYRIIKKDEYVEDSIVIIANDNLVINEDGSYEITDLTPKTSIDLINSLTLNGLVVKNQYSNRNVKINLRFLARQKDHIDSSDLENMGEFNLI